MDSVRFGRALGFGARSAARAISGALDAAAAPNPAKPASTAKTSHPNTATNPRPSTSRPSISRASTSSPSTSDPIASRPIASGPIATAAKTAAHATIQARETRKGIARGSKRFGESVWGPFAKLSGVLWLELTGSFFGIFALFAGSAVWANRAQLHTTPGNRDGRLHVLVFVAMTLVFGYFCISSFLRAYRK